MKLLQILSLLFFLNCSSGKLFSQNETTQWHFGYGGTLNFMTTPPSSLAATSMTAYENSASMADANGNLLFYTQGQTVWNKNNQIMANGSGLLGDQGSTQGVLILKKPGSQNLYYIFTIAQPAPGNALRYSIVDMSLASGDGSVTVKNATLLAQTMTEKITGTQHCNGTDYWIVVHDAGSDVFRTLLLNAAGISTTVITTTLGSTHAGTRGQMKISPAGNRLVMTRDNGPGTNMPGGYELFDFDNSSGAITNSLSLGNSIFGPWGVAFSPDGSKLFTTATVPTGIFQWDLCAGTASAIISSSAEITSAAAFGQDLQLAPDGKIYCAPFYNSNYLHIINYPNLSSTNVGFAKYGYTLTPAKSGLGLPNFIGSMVKASFDAIQTSTCLTTSFNSLSSSGSGCSAGSASVISETWNFGDATSGALNTSTLSSPIHSYPAVGYYTVSLIRQTSCGYDTVRRPVFVKGPTPTFSVSSRLCNGVADATISAEDNFAPYTYTWLASNISSSNAVNIAPGIYTIIIAGNVPGCITTVTTSVAPFYTLTLQGQTVYYTNCDPLYGQALAYPTGSGLSGYHSYLWSPGSHTTASVYGLSTGVYTVTVTDDVYNCSATKTLNVVQWSYPNITLTGDTTLCAGQSTTLQMTGAPTYSWAERIYTDPLTSYLAYGPTTSSIVLSPTTSVTYYHAIAGNTFVIPNSTNIATCATELVFNITSIPNPTVTVSGASKLCSGESTTLSASGASSYSWTGYSLPSSSIVVTPSTSVLNYTATGTNTYVVSSSTGSLACTSSASFTVTRIITPTLLVSGNFEICKGQTAVLVASGASTYSWNGYGAGPSLSITPDSTFTTYTVTGTAATYTCFHSTSVGVEIIDCVNLENYDSASFDFILYPNPASEILNLKLMEYDFDKIDKIEISDAVGRIKKVLFKEEISALTVIDLKSFSNGMYYLRVGLKNNALIARKFTVSR